MPGTLKYPNARINKKIVRILILLTILIIAIFLRGFYSGFTLIFRDYDAFYHARIARYIYENHNIPSWDYQELGGIPHYYPPVYHILITLGKYILPGEDFIVIGSLLTVFFGVVGTLFVYLVGRKLSEKIGITSALLFTITPAMLLRSGPWARPTGLTILFTIMLVYFLLRVIESRNLKNISLLLFLSIAYVFAHSSIIFILVVIASILIISGNKKCLKIFLVTSAISSFAGVLYYYKIFSFLDFSIPNAGEYLPLTHIIIALYPFQDYWTIATVLIRLGLFNLTILPIVIHGTYVMAKRKKQLGILALFSLITIFFKANMLMLLNFAICIAIATSIFRISNMGLLRNNRTINGRTLAVLLLIIVIIWNMFLIYRVHGEQKIIYVDAIREVIIGAPLTSKNLVLSNNPYIGHEIAYYSTAGVFLSDLTDTKQFSKNLGVIYKLFDRDITNIEAIQLLEDNNIDHLLIIENFRSFPFLKNSTQNFTEINKFDKNGITAYLLKLENKI